MTVRRLLPADAEQFQAVRLRGLQECPDAFASSYAEEVQTPLAEVAERLAQNSGGAIFGWFGNSVLQGVVGVQREGMAKLAHKAFIWGMYVAPEARRAGVGQELLAQALEYARAELGVHQVNLGVNTQNHAALALYRRAGFEVYGTERGFLLIDGVLHDEHHMVCRVRNSAEPFTRAESRRRGAVSSSARTPGSERSCRMVCHFRVARPVTDLARTEAMYREGLGLVRLGHFDDHEGFDGVMLGEGGGTYHFEFTFCRSHPVKPTPTPEDLLVFYVPDREDWVRCLESMKAAGFKAVTSLNPYWDRDGCTFEDPDGYRVVVQCATWESTPEPSKP